MKKFKKGLALLLSILMVFSLFSATAITTSAATAAGEKLYLLPNSNWKTDGARFAAYFFGAGDKWLDMTASEEEGLYEVAIPDGGYTTVIFCRMNPSATANNWNNKWNQTGDLVLGDWNTCAISGWDKTSSQSYVDYAAGEIATEPEKVFKGYSVAGVSGLTGAEWDPNQNFMNDDDKDGIYTITFNDIAAGDYEFKVTDGTWDNSWGDNGSNYKINVAEASNVTITFDSEKEAIEVSIVSVSGETTAPTDPKETDAPAPAEYYLMGTLSDWATGLLLNTSDNAGVVTTTLELKAGEYEFKIKSGDTWYGNNGTIEDTTNATAETGWTMKTDTGNCTLVATGGTYTFNLDTATMKLIILYASGTPDNTEPSTQAPTDVEEIKPTLPAEVTTLYLVPSVNWKDQGARFAAYFFGNDANNAWVDMTDEDGDATYEAVVPEGAWTNVIFCRMDSATTENNWDNVWNQTGNLAYDATKTSFRIYTDSWDDGYWTAPDEHSVYFVNTLGWAEVAGYGYTDGIGGSTVYPGTLATVVDAEIGVYSYDPGNRKLVLFNDNTAEGESTSFFNCEDIFGKYIEPKTNAVYDTLEDALMAYAGATPPSSGEGETTETEAPVPAEYYLMGTLTDWDNGLLFNKTDDADVVTATVELKAGEYEFKVKSGENWYGNNGTIADTTVTTSETGWVMDAEGNCKLQATGGTYTFNYVISTNSIIVLYTPDEDASKETDAPGPKKYALAGSFNGVDKGINSDEASIPYEFDENNQLQLTLEGDNYVIVKTTDNTEWYWTNGWLGSDKTEAILYKNAENPDKLFVPAGKVTFTLVENEDGTLTLSYEVTEPASSETTETKETTPVEKPEVLYLVPNANWASDGARFVAYFFDGTEEPIWVDLTDEDGDGTYEVAVAEGYASVIFCRMDGSTTENNWDNVWNQTGDLSIGANNTYTLTEDTWNGEGAWSTPGEGDTTPTTPSETEAPVPAEYYLMGTLTDWETGLLFEKTDDANVVTVTVELKAGEYEFKVKSGENWYGNSGTIADTTVTTSETGWVMDSGDNCKLQATGGTYTFNYVISTNSIIVLYTPGEGDTTATTPSDTAPVVPNVYSIAGVKELCGSEWDAADANNDMTDNGDGTYTKVYSDVVAGTYEFKVVTNHDWNNANYGGENGANYSVTVANNGATLTINFNATTGAITTAVEGGTPAETTPSSSEAPADKVYSVVGSIDGVDVGINSDDANEGFKLDENGQVTLTITNKAYLAVKATDNSAWYMTNGWLGEEVTSATLYNTKDLGENADKLFVPAGTAVVTVVFNEDGTLTMSYEMATVPSESTKPSETTPAPSESESTKPSETTPAPSESESTAPSETTPAPSESESTAPSETTPTPSESESTAPTETEPQPTETEPQPTETEPQPTAPKTMTAKADSKKIKAGATTTVKVEGNEGKVTYKTSDKKIAKVSAKGVVTGLTKGNVTITATDEAGKTAKVTVKVKSSPKLSSKKVSVKVKKKATVTVSGAATKIKVTECKFATFKVKKNKITVTGKKKGTATVNVKVNGAKLKLKVTVKKK